MKTLHSLVAGFRPASLILARRIAFPLLFLGAGLMLVQPSAGAPFEFEQTGSLHTARDGQTATLLTDGKVLVAGGAGTNYVSLASAELYDRHAEPGRLLAASAPHAMVTRRLCCPTARCSSQGVRWHRGYLASAELYDPTTGTWSATGSLTTARESHTATLLPNGKVLVAGGITCAIASAEVYHPASGSWRCWQPRHRTLCHTATLLPNGKVLVAGG